MLQAMYNQAAARKGFVPTPAYVASTITSGRYLGYPAGKAALISALRSSPGSNACDHLVSTEATYGEFWDGSHAISDVNVWVAVYAHGLQQPGDIVFAGSVFWYMPNVTSAPPHKNRPIRLPAPVRPRG